MVSDFPVRLRLNREAVTAGSRGCKPTENERTITKVAKRRQKRLMLSFCRRDAAFGGWSNRNPMLTHGATSRRLFEAYNAKLFPLGTTQKFGSATLLVFVRLQKSVTPK